MSNPERKASDDSGIRFDGAIDPELLAAADEVDTTLLQWALELTPLERLESALRFTFADATATGLVLPRHWNQCMDFAWK